MDPELIDIIDGEDEITFVLRYPDGRIVRKIVKHSEMAVTSEVCPCCGEIVLTTSLDI